MYIGCKKIILGLALLLYAPCPAMAQVTDAGDVGVLRRIQNENNCNGVLDGWELIGDYAAGPGITADSKGSLAELDIEGRYICGELTIHGLEGLVVLRISGADLNGVSLDGLSGMRELRLSYVQPVDFAFLGQMPQLETLQLDSTGLSELSPMVNLLELQTADLSYNRISDLSALKELAKLNDLKLFHNLINDIRPLAALTELTRLNLETNKIVDIKPLAALRKLGELNLAENRIIDIYALQQMPVLATLNLSDNLVSDIGALSKIPTLRNLDIRRNRIRDIRELKNVWERFELVELEGNSIPLHQMYDETTEHRWAAAQNDVYFRQRAQYLPVLDYWVIPQEDLKINDTESRVRIEGPSGGASYDAEKGRIVFEKAGNYKIVISNSALVGADTAKPIPVTKSGVITVLDVLPDELELYAGREEIVSPAVVNTLYLLLQTHGVVETLDELDPYHDAVWILSRSVRPSKLYWQQP